MFCDHHMSRPTWLSVSDSLSFFSFFFLTGLYIIMHKTCGQYISCELPSLIPSIATWDISTHVYSWCTCSHGFECLQGRAFIKRLILELVKQTASAAIVMRGVATSRRCTQWLLVTYLSQLVGFTISCSFRMIVTGGAGNTTERFLRCSRWYQTVTEG